MSSGKMYLYWSTFEDKSMKEIFLSFYIVLLSYQPNRAAQLVNQARIHSNPTTKGIWIQKKSCSKERPKYTLFPEVCLPQPFLSLSSKCWYDIQSIMFWKTSLYLRWSKVCVKIVKRLEKCQMLKEMPAEPVSLVR